MKLKLMFKNMSCYQASSEIIVDRNMKDTSGTCFEKSSGPLVSAKNIKLQIASFF